MNDTYIEYEWNDIPRIFSQGIVTNARVPAVVGIYVFKAKDTTGKKIKKIIEINKFKIKLQDIEEVQVLMLDHSRIFIISTNINDDNYTEINIISHTTKVRFFGTSG